MIVDSVAQLASPPLFFKLEGLIRQPPIYIKVEGFNAAGSIKLKTANQIIDDLEERRILRPDSRIIESSSGNLGVALALVCAERRYQFTCVTDPHIPPPTRRVLEVLGARVIVVRERDEGGGFLGTRLKLIGQMVADDPELVWTDQYSNPANALAHYNTTGPEILDSFTEPDWVFIGAGTTGTLAGCSRFLRTHSPKTRIVAVDSIGSVTFNTPSGPRYVPGLGTSIRPLLAQHCQMDVLELVSEEEAVMTCRKVARQHGLLLGGSTGSVLAAVIRLADKFREGQTVVAISPDLGDKYLNSVYDSAWAQEHFPPSCGMLPDATGPHSVRFGSASH